MLYLSPQSTGRELAATPMMTMIDGVPQRLQLADDISIPKRVPATPPGMASSDVAAQPPPPPPDYTAASFAGGVATDIITKIGEEIIEKVLST
jgi:hypothetical protein